MFILKVPLAGHNFILNTLKSEGIEFEEILLIEPLLKITLQHVNLIQVY